MKNKYLCVNDIVKAINIIYAYEGFGCIKVDTYGIDDVREFKLTISKFNPYAPYAHTSVVGSAIKVLQDYGLVYSSDGLSIIFSLRSDIRLGMYYTSAVVGYTYSYEDVNFILDNFRDKWIVNPKLVNLKEGDFISENIGNKIKSIYRVGNVSHSDYTIFNILNETQTNKTFPSSIDKVSVNNSDECSYKLISRDNVEKYIINIEKSDMVNSLSSLNLVVGNYKQEDMFKYWNTCDIDDLICSYSRRCIDEFKLFRVFNKGVKVYEPIGNFVFSGHKTKIFE